MGFLNGLLGGVNQDGDSLLFFFLLLIVLFCNCGMFTDENGSSLLFFFLLLVVLFCTSCGGDDC